MKILWISALPAAVEQAALGGKATGNCPAVSWILAHLPPPQGIELHIAVLSPGASEYRHIDYSGAQFHLIPCPKRGRALMLFLRDTALFRPLFNQLRPDIVHGWGTEDSFGLVSRRLAPSRHVVGIQGLITEYRKRVAMPTRTLLTEMTERWTLKKARWVVAESNYSLNAARPFCPKAQLMEIEHPLREEFLDSEMADGSARKVLFVGNLDARKGIWDAISAFASAASREWTLHVIGSGDPASESALMAKADELGIRDRLLYQKNLQPAELACVMRASSVFLLPTRIDTGPTALKEALAMGLWPVCYDNSGPGEYIRNFGFGTLANDLDLPDLRNRFAELLTVRPWMESARREELHRRTRERFGKQEVWAKLKALYEEVSKSS